MVGWWRADQWDRGRGLSGNQWVASKYLVTVSGCYPLYAAATPCGRALPWPWPAPANDGRWCLEALAVVYQQPSTGMEQHSLEVNISTKYYLTL